MSDRTVLRSAPQDVLLACRTRLIEVVRFPVERIRLFDPDLFNPSRGNQADQVLNFWPDVSTPTENYLGAGRIDCRRQLRLVVQVATRYGVDEDGSNEQWLVDQQNGHLEMLMRVEDALIQFIPQDAHENWLVTHPIEPGQVGKPQPDRKEPGWGYTRLGYVATLMLDLDQHYDGQLEQKSLVPPGSSAPGWGDRPPLVVSGWSLSRAIGKSQ